MDPMWSSMFIWCIRILDPPRWFGSSFECWLFCDCFYWHLIGSPRLWSLSKLLVKVPWVPRKLSNELCILVGQWSIYGPFGLWQGLKQISASSTIFVYTILIPPQQHVYLNIQDRIFNGHLTSLSWNDCWVMNKQDPLASFRCTLHGKIL